MLNPWLWLGILVTGIVGIYAWEYGQNPGQLPWQISATGSGGAGDAASNDALESLTPEEQSLAAELDNIELLLEQFDSDISALTSGGEESAAASLNESLDAAGEPVETSVERLSRYIDEYSFLGTRARGSNIDEAERQSGASLAQQSLTLQETDGSEPATVLSRSALADALSRQQTQQQTVTEPRSASGAQSADESAAAAPEETEAEPSTFSFDQSGVVPGSLNGLNQTFIRTTPNMSPPPGTTGYVPPATLPRFNSQNQQAGVVPFPTQRATGSFESVIPSPEDRSQVLPPAESGVNTQLPTPTFDTPSQTAPDQPRNAWDSFWD